MTKTEAAEIFGLEVFLYAQRNSRELSRELVEARYSELFYSDRGIDKAILKAAPSWKTILKFAKSA